MCIDVGIVGATGIVGQKLIVLLKNHPLFRITELVASERSAGKMYKDAVNWVMDEPLPDSLKKMSVVACGETLRSKLLFSALDTGTALLHERKYAENGHIIISNASSYRLYEDVPLLIPEVNACHISAIEKQQYYQGAIITNPNCSVTGIAIALKPVWDTCGIESVHAVTMQAISGAGYSGLSAVQAIDNIIPYIAGEEEKIETELKKIYGVWDGDAFYDADIHVSAQCYRVPVIDGHMAALRITLSGEATVEDVKNAVTDFNTECARRALHTSPETVLSYTEITDHPQTRLHRNAGHGMSVSMGRMRMTDKKIMQCCVLSHNTVRGAAGAAILNAELFAARYGERLR